MNLLPIRVLVLASFISAIFLPGSQMQARDLLGQGDDLSEYIKTSKKLYVKGKSKISAWLEGEFYLYSTTAEFETGQPLVITSPKKLSIPFWVVFENSTKMGPQKGIFTIMSLMYGALRSNEGTAINPKTKQALSILEEFAGDAEKVNRDLVYLPCFYSRHNRNELELSFYAVEELCKRIRNRYNQVRPLNLLYAAECFIRLRQIRDAGMFLKDLLTLDPDFVPAKVYQHQLESDTEKADSLLKELKENKATIGL